jgi:hypothetical protein
LEVTLEDIVLQGGPVLEPGLAGCRWLVDKLQGWFDSPVIRNTDQPREDQDGSWPVDVLLGSRPISINGVVDAPDPVSLRRAVDALNSLLVGQQRRGVLTVNEVRRGLSRRAEVQLNGPTLVDERNDRQARFSIALKAEDPLRYGSELKTASAGRYQPGEGTSAPWTAPFQFGAVGAGGIIQVDNAGSYPTPSTIYLYGPLTNPVVRYVEGNQTISLQMGLDTGQTVELRNNPRSPRVLLDGSSRYARLSSAQFFLLPPGVSTIYFSADSGSGSMMIAWRDAS